MAVYPAILRTLLHSFTILDWTLTMVALAYLSVVDHMNPLVNDVFGVFAQEVQDVLHLCLIGKSS